MEPGRGDGPTVTPSPEAAVVYHIETKIVTLQVVATDEVSRHPRPRGRLLPPGGEGATRGAPMQRLLALLLWSVRDRRRGRRGDRRGSGPASSGAPEHDRSP